MGYEKRSKRKQIRASRENSRLKEKDYKDVNEKLSLWRRLWNLVK